MCDWVGHSEGQLEDGGEAESQEVGENSFLDINDQDAAYVGLGDQESEVDDSKEELEVLGGLPTADAEDAT